MDKYIVLSCWNKLTAHPCSYVTDEALSAVVWLSKMCEMAKHIYRMTGGNNCISLRKSWPGLYPNPRPGEWEWMLCLGQLHKNAPSEPAGRITHLHQAVSIEKGDFRFTLLSGLHVSALEWLKGKRCLFFLLLWREHREESKKRWQFDHPVS